MAAGPDWLSKLPDDVVLRLWTTRPHLLTRRELRGWAALRGSCRAMRDLCDRRQMWRVLAESLDGNPISVRPMGRRGPLGAWVVLPGLKMTWGRQDETGKRDRWWRAMVHVGRRALWVRAERAERAGM